jgi:hypothetical protein
MWWKKLTTRAPAQQTANDDLALEDEQADKVGGGYAPGPPSQVAKLPPGPPN